METQLRTIAAIAKEPNVFYEPFDFYAECSKIRLVLEIFSLSTI